VCRARKKGLAYLILIATSYKRGLRSKPPNINICGQQTISQLIIGDQLIFDYGDDSIKCRGYLVPELLIVVFGTQLRLVS
jgi:hypothetical protein